MKRCTWAEQENMRKYHDTEWGVPVFDDKKLFEFLVLEGAQAGLSWSTVLNKRKGYSKAFANFNVKKVAKMTDAELEKLLLDPSIIRNRLKVFGARKNAHAFIAVQKEFGSFSKYIWDFVKGKPMQNKFKKMSDLPATTPLSDKISKDMKKRGFTFVGSTIIYAHMQATGMVNDHETSCFRYKEVQK